MRHSTLRLYTKNRSLENQVTDFVYFCGIMKRILLIIGLVLMTLCVSAQNEKVTFSHAGGFYEDSFSLVLSNANHQNAIRFTTNGNRPTAQSQLYTGPLRMNESLYSQSDIFTIQIAPENNMHHTESVHHCIIIRAAVFDENGNCVSDVVTNSYFIHALGCNTHDLPVVSLCADSLDLFDFQNGILVPGTYFDSENSDWTGNYYQEGQEWERLCNVEFYENDNSGINQQAGVRTHGGNGRRFQQKALKIYAREEYGKKRFKHKFFEHCELMNFKHLVLKPFMSSWTEAGLQDYICGRIASQLNVESLASRPSVLFLNGEYWGIYYVEEKSDERYLEDHFGIDPDNCNIMGNWYGMVENGSNIEFSQIMDWLFDADLTQQNDYELISHTFDLDCFTDYQILEIFLANYDWPENNTRCWQSDDRLWRWIFYDGDACLSSIDKNFFDVATAVNTVSNENSKATILLRKLLENQDFRKSFCHRFNELLLTAFNYESTWSYLDEIKDIVESEIENQSERFGMPIDHSSWEKSIARIDDFLRTREIFIWQHLYDFMSINNKIESIGCYPNPSNGPVSIAIESDVYGWWDLSIFDITGRMVFHTITDETKIQLDLDLKSGLYFISAGNKIGKMLRTL